MNAGFFKLKRSFFSHWLWDEERVYNRGEAFLDLLQLAAFAPTKRIVKDQLIQVPIGGVIASERFLAVRWKWSRNKVRHFLHLLKEDKMLDQRKDQGQTVLILCNYERHAACQTTEGPLKVPDEDQLRTSEGPNKKKGKNEKNKSVVVFPHDSPSFKAAWTDWEQHRIEIKKKLTPTSRASQFKKLGAMTEWKAIDTIERSIAGGWVGLFEDESKNDPTKPATSPKPHKPQPNMQL